MTRREFFRHENTYKSHMLRLAYIGNKRPTPYRYFILHLMVNAQTMFVKSALMEMHKRAIQESDNA